MTDLAVPATLERILGPVHDAQTHADEQFLNPGDIARLIEQQGMELETPSLAWREAGARAILLTAMSQRYLIETNTEARSLVSRINELPEKARKVGPFTMLPIDRCEVEIDDVIILGKDLTLGGLCRATKRWNPSGGGFQTGPVSSVAYLPRNGTI